MFIARLQSVPCKTFDGQSWYRTSDICRALQVRQDKASKLVDKSDKRREYRFCKGYRSYHEYYINRHGVEAIVTRYCGATGYSRGELMSALPP